MFINTFQTGLSTDDSYPAPLVIVCIPQLKKITHESIALWGTILLLLRNIRYHSWILFAYYRWLPYLRRCKGRWPSWYMSRRGCSSICRGYLVPACKGDGPGRATPGRGTDLSQIFAHAHGTSAPAERFRCLVWKASWKHLEKELRPSVTLSLQALIGKLGFLF